MSREKGAVMTPEGEILLNEAGGAVRACIRRYNKFTKNGGIFWTVQYWPDPGCSAGLPFTTTDDIDYPYEVLTDEHFKRLCAAGKMTIRRTKNGVLQPLK